MCLSVIVATHPGVRRQYAGQFNCVNGYSCRGAPLLAGAFRWGVAGAGDAAAVVKLTTDTLATDAVAPVDAFHNDRFAHRPVRAGRPRGGAELDPAPLAGIIRIARVIAVVPAIDGAADTAGRAGFAGFVGVAAGASFAADAITAEAVSERPAADVARPAAPAGRAPVRIAPLAGVGRVDLLLGVELAVDRAATGLRDVRAGINDAAPLNAARLEPRTAALTIRAANTIAANLVEVRTTFRQEGRGRPRGGILRGITDFARVVRVRIALGVGLPVDLAGRVTGIGSGGAPVSPPPTGIVTCACLAGQPDAAFARGAADAVTAFPAAGAPAGVAIVPERPLGFAAIGIAVPASAGGLFGSRRIRYVADLALQPT